MNLIHAILLGLVQGVTEFLPVSSSAHLVLVPWWLGWGESGLAFDTLLHWGTLLAVVFYFWRDWWEMLQAAVAWLSGRRNQEGRERLLLAVIVGTIPAAVIGFFFEDFFESLFAAPAVVAGFLFLTCGLLLLAERWQRTGLPLERIRLSDAAAIGLAQALAITPGISRSGSTIAMGLLRGLDRSAAARFSFLLSTPIIFGAGLFQLLKVLDAGMTETSATTLIAGFIAAALSGFLSIRFLMRYLQRHPLTPFAIYVAVFATLSLLRAALM